MADEINKVVILGSGPAGLTAALYTARANLSPLLIEGNEPGGQLTITTDVENYPGFEHGIQGPEMMDVFRRQATRFGTRFMTGAMTEARLGKRPFELVVVERQAGQGRGRDHFDRRVGKAAGDRIGKTLDGLRCERMRHLRRRILQRQGSDRGWRRRYRDGGSELPDQIRHQSHDRASPRRAACIEDHAGLRAPQSEDWVPLGIRQSTRFLATEKRRERRQAEKSQERRDRRAQDRRRLPPKSPLVISRTPRSSRAEPRWTRSAI